MSRRLNKFFVFFLVTIFLGGNAAPAFAQFGEVPISHPGLGQGGLVGSITSGVAQATLAGVVTANEACQKAEEAFGTADHVREIAFGGLSLIAGSAAEVAQIETKVQALEGFIKCREGVRTSLKAVPSPNLFVGQSKQRLEEEINLAIQTLKKRKDDLNVQSRIAKRGLWKGIIVKVLLSTTKAIAQKLVNNLSNTYKIRDFQGYADAVASQVYTTNLIRNNARDGTDQLILRSMLNNPLAVQSVMPAVRQRADAALGFAPDEVDFNDPDFYSKMSRVGASDTNPFAVHAAMIDQAYQMQSKGLESAKSEIVQSNGFKTPKDCPGNVAEQRLIDQRYQAVSREAQDRTKLYLELVSAKNLGQPVSDQDITRARQDMEQANKQLGALPKSYQSPVLEICKSITSPASLVDKGIDKAFNQFAKNLGDYNDNNLPFFVNFISDIASGIAGNLIFGGNTGNVLLSESVNIDRALGAGLAFATSGNSSQNLQNGINFAYEKSANFADAYILSWEVLDVKDANYVAIQGTGISPTQKLPLSGSTEVRTSSSGSYLLKVFDSKGKQLSSASIDLQVQQTNPYFGGSGPQVFGTQILKKLPQQIRGPVSIQPRGLSD